MEARSLIIKEKLRTGDISVVSPSDFRVRDGGAIDPRIVLQQPNLSLYCLDFENRQALFVETPPECDLSHAPFLYQAQSEAALRLVQVPYETLLQCAPGMGQGATAWALKFRSMVTAMGERFYAAFPEARLVFLYRNAEPWARSFLRLMQVPNPTAPMPLQGSRERFGRVFPWLDARETVSALDMLACMWGSVMENCRAMQRHGFPLFLARYEELNAATREVLAAMFAHCGLSASAVGDLDAVLAADSQAGSALSRASVGEASVPVSRENLDILCRLIRERAPELEADTILPGTYLPGSAPQEE